MKDDALKLRDLALAVILSNAEIVSGISQVSASGIRIALRSPRSGMHLDDPQLLPWGLDIWASQIRGKALHIEWDNNGTSRILLFRRGAWEQTLIALASSAP